MKNLCVYLLLCLTNSTYAQDFLITNKNEFFKVKVVEINQTEVKYKSFSNLNGPIKVLLKEEIRAIKYENGEVEKFESIIKPSEIDVTTNEQDFFSIGSKDAYKYYNGYTGAGTGTLFTGLLISPLIGLVPALVTAGTPPAENSLNYPNSTLMQNPEYARGYKQTAFTIKKSKVWTNWMVTFGVSVVAYSVLYKQLYLTK